MKKEEVSFIAAAGKGNVEKLQELINIGVDIDCCHPYKRITALHKAKAARKISAVEFLINHGANIQARDYRGNTPLVATYDCSVYGIEPVYFLTEGDIERLLIAKGADPNEQFQNDDTLIHRSVGINFIKFLLDNGIDINRIGSKGRTALYMRVEDLMPDVVNFLLENNADPNIAERDCESTPLHRILWGYSDPKIDKKQRKIIIEIATLLIKHGAIQNEKDTYRKFTPSEYAVVYNHLDVLKQLSFIDRNAFKLAETYKQTKILEYLNQLQVL